MENIKELRKEAGLTQIEVALHAGISLQGYQLIERGITKNPAPETRKKIEEVLCRKK